MKYKFGEVGNNKKWIPPNNEYDKNGNYRYGEGHWESAPRYDTIVEFTHVKKGKHKGEILVEVGREPQEGFEISQYRSRNSTEGRRTVKKGYISVEALRKFLEDEIS